MHLQRAAVRVHALDLAEAEVGAGEHGLRQLGIGGHGLVQRTYVPAAQQHHASVRHASRSPFKCVMTDD
jgi:hypothetical protein